MEIQKVVVFRGPNIWARFPVLEAWVDLGDLKDSPSNEIAGFNERLMGWLPGMIEHRCSIGERGGFFERLRRGTYLAHILEHVTLELQGLAGSPLGYGRARETMIEGLFRVAVRYDEEALARASLLAARELCLAAVFDRPYDAGAEVRRLRKMAEDVLMGASTRTVADAARARGIPVHRLNDASLLQLGNGAKQHRVHRSATDHTIAVAESVSDDKDVTKTYLRAAGVPVAQGRLASSAADAWQAAQEIGAPVVIKPKDANYGNGVVIGISGRDQIEAAYRHAATQGSGVIVEQLASGLEHRLLVVGGKFIAATRGNPAEVIGDGKQTIRELIESQLNSDPRRGTDLSCPLAKVEIDPSVELALANEGFRPESVPAKDQTVMIQRNGNLALDVTDEVHPAVQRHAEMAATVIGLDVAGIDVIAEDISRPLEVQGGVIIEVNSSPGLHTHIAPELGTPRPVGEAIVGTLFPPGDEGRIPIVGVTGSRDAGPIARWIAGWLSSRGKNVGLGLAEETFVGPARLAAVRPGLDAARSLLLNPLVEAAVFELPLDRMLDEGVGFDRCEVAVITDIGPGIRVELADWDSPDRQVMVHRVVSDVVEAKGALVLPADEPLASHITKHCAGETILFAADASSPGLAEHRAAGGRAVFLRDRKVLLASAASEMVIPNLRAGENSDVLLASVAAAWGLGATIEELTVLQATSPFQDR
jgi:cyanophycin synthetase